MLGTSALHISAPGPSLFTRTFFVQETTARASGLQEQYLSGVQGREMRNTPNNHCCSVINHCYIQPLSCMTESVEGILQK